MAHGSSAGIDTPQLSPVWLWMPRMRAPATRNFSDSVALISEASSACKRI